MQVIKRDGSKENFNIEKIESAIAAAFLATNEVIPTGFMKRLRGVFDNISEENIGIEQIQDTIEDVLLSSKCHKVSRAFIVYREKHKELRFIKDRAEYIERYSTSAENAATMSEVDGNANVQNKNVATLEAELYKPTNVEVSRYRVTKKLKELNSPYADQYIKDLESHWIYKHDESSAPAIKPYCVAANLFPFLQRGTSTLDKLNTSAPKNITSFSGQFVNLVFLLSSQFQGAVAFGEFFNVFTYYCIKEYGPNFMDRIDIQVLDTGIRKKTTGDLIDQAFQNIVYTINQPMGNRSYQSPFTNVSYFDRNYWEAMFGDFVFPDGSKVSYDQVNFIQKRFMKWFNAERKKTLLTFPVETVAMLHDGKDILDKEWKDFVAEMYAEGHSFFTYLSDSPDSIASCCRLRNAVKPEFSFTSGNVGVATGSKSVITLNLNRIIQDTRTEFNSMFGEGTSADFMAYLRGTLENVLERIYHYHVAYNELLKDLVDNDMMPAYSEGYINLRQQFLTIGINGLNEAAEFLGMTCNDNKEYEGFCRLITSTISEQNREHQTKELKFNTEFVPAEGLGVKNYNWDKQDGYVVPKDRNCYTSYFFKPDDDSISVLEQFRMQGKRYTDTLDGGVALHCNLEDHPTKEQYIKLIDYAIQEGTNYFTFNIPNTQCDDCGFITKHPVDVCPKCGSKHTTQWTRIIGYLRPIKGYSKGRKIEASKRIYNKGVK